MWCKLRWKQLYKPASHCLKRHNLRPLYTNCETDSKTTEDTLRGNAIKPQDSVGVARRSSADLRRRYKPATDTSYGKKLLREWQISSKEDKETLFLLANWLGYYGPSIYRIVETGDILSLKKSNPGKYFSFLLENIATVTQLSSSLYEKAQQETRERSEHLQVYLEVLLCSGHWEEVYHIYSKSPPWAMSTSSALKPCVYVYSMAALCLLGDRARCSALLYEVLNVADVRTKDNLGFAVLETLRNVERLEAALEWLEFCRTEQVALNIPATFLEPFVDNNDIFMVERILRFCSEYNGGNIVFTEDEKVLQKEKKKSESLLKIVIFLLENREWSLKYMREEQLLGFIVNHVQDLEALYGFLDGLCILNQHIQPLWMRKLLFLCKSSKSETNHFLTPCLVVSLLQRSKIVNEEVASLVLEWAKEQKDFESARRLLEFLESQFCSISPFMVKLYIQLAAEMTRSDELCNVATTDNVSFSSLKEPSHVISHLEEFLQYLESKGMYVSQSVLLEIESTLENFGLVDYLGIVQKRLQ
ncbi:hypothetical protein GpartN1_g2708.t1 [Galdieria partita]|uniref:Uncharacterized protein n=1 Tax=Galdieria partita TaxID=83374 RepID=A0A9C7PWE3_9RHOD|nr:hypothetical protein GpartN1_g2708.t1 [Galdieria partita]